MRSPVETRCAGVAAIIRFQNRIIAKKAPAAADAPKTMRSLAQSEAKLVVLNKFQDVAVHHKGENAQQEHQTYLHEPLLHGDAQVAAQQTFDSQQQHMSAVEDWNREQVQQSEVEADDGHQLD